MLLKKKKDIKDSMLLFACQLKSKMTRLCVKKQKETVNQRGFLNLLLEIFNAKIIF